MQTYTFSELTKRAKTNAINRYGEEQAVAEVIETAKTEDITTENAFNSLAWRFTEHGERIA